MRILIGDFSMKTSINSFIELLRQDVGCWVLDVGLMTFDLVFRTYMELELINLTF